MSVEAKIVGYDRSSERAGVELDVPSLALPAVMRIADVSPGDPELLGSYPLNERQLALIAEAAQMTIDPSRFVYFLEAYDE